MSLSRTLTVPPRPRTEVRDRPAAQADRQVRPIKVAYLVSRFPKITETFILAEMVAVQQEHVQVELYALQRERTSVMHPEAHAFMARANFHPFLSPAVVSANVAFLLRQPLTYMHTLWTLLRANWGSARYFAGAVVFFPKAVYFARKMQAQGVEHIHAHFASHPAAMAYAIHRLTGIPYSFTAHGSDLHRDKHMLREKVASAAFVVTISHYNKEIIVRECGEAWRDKVYVVHCGVDTHLFSPPPPALRKKGGPFTIVCVGTLHEVKGQTYLVEACRHLLKQGVPFECHFIGDGPDMGKLTRQVQEAGLEGHVHFHGRRTRHEVLELLRQADVLVAPSVPSRDGRREGIPVVLMEAMACGVPVVASRLSGIPELVDHGENGFLVRPGDVGGLVEALLRLYRDPVLRSRFGTSGRAKVVREFDVRRNAETLARLFREKGL